MLELALQQAWQQLEAAGERPDQLLITGDLCQDESWGGYGRLRELLAASPFADLPSPWLLSGNHDHSLRLRAALGRRAVIAPTEIHCAGWQVPYKCITSCILELTASPWEHPGPPGL